MNNLRRFISIKWCLVLWRFNIGYPLTSIITYTLTIQPKKIYRKKLHKRRWLPTPQPQATLLFGTTGLLFLRSFQMTSKQLGRLVLILKRIARKREQTNRSFWMRVFPNFPLTRKVLNSRMGKGKGKYKNWTLRIKGNAMFVELERIKNGRLLYMARQIRARTTPLLTLIYQTPIKSPLFILHTASKRRL